MAIIEWKGRSGIGGQLDGNLMLASESDIRVYDDFVKSLRGAQVSFFLSFLYLLLINIAEEENLHESPRQNLALFQ
jgi:hypothetical protein